MDLLQKDRVIDRINELFIATDEKQWERVRACFTTDIVFDMSSLTGQPPSTVPSADVVAGWKAGLAPIEAVHHQVGNYRVTGGEREADAFCYGIAMHYRKTASGRNTRTFVGSYQFHLVRDGEAWQIDRFRFEAKFVDGNLQLEADS
jgi:hypothetical protein